VNLTLPVLNFDNNKEILFYAMSVDLTNGISGNVLLIQ
jgi:hypothetical protein